MKHVPLHGRPPKLVKRNRLAREASRFGEERLGQIASFIGQLSCDGGRLRGRTARMGNRVSSLTCYAMVNGGPDLSDASGGSYLEGLDAGTMDSAVWKNIPEDVLLNQIVSKLPFNVLLNFCTVSREWNRFIRSMDTDRANRRSNRSILIHSALPLRILDTVSTSGTGGHWIHPEPFLPNLRVLASAGGLLCLSTENFGELLIRNPVTKAERRIQMPLDQMHGNCLHHLFQTQADLANPGRWMTKLIFAGWLRVGLTYRSKTSSYRVILAAVSTHLPGATVLYDSRTRNWRTGPNIPQGIRFELNSIPSQCGRYFYCCIVCGMPNYMMEFDFDRNKWAYFRVRFDMGIPESLIEHHGVVLLVVRARAGHESFTVYELQMRLRYTTQNMRGEYKWEQRTAQHMPGMLSRKAFGAMKSRPANLLMKMGDRFVQCFGTGDLIFFVGTAVEKWYSSSSLDFRTVGMCRGGDSTDIVQEPTRGLYLLRSYLRVWIHDVSSDCLLHLTDWEFQGYDDANLASFTLLTPSLCSQP
ncbi:hypothetical protein R1sor_001718 [Riccia sorocarpa]|uniref:F-box domain-containing protein n=1 Tax=Riccia sorocarpa TaxID=122646 RepID=A0ABD3H0Y9_9MARC